MKKLPPWGWAVIVLLLVLLFNLVKTPGFFEFHVRDGRIYGSLIDILNRATPVLLLSLGMTLVIATGGVDLSVGAVMAMTGATAACLIAQPTNSPLSSINVHQSIPQIIVISLFVALLCGTFNGMLVSWLGLQPIVATLLLMVAGRGIAQLLSNGQIITFQFPAFQAIGNGGTLGLPNPMWIGVIVACLFGLLVRGTALGLFVSAVGSNPIAAKNSGINPGRVKMVAYVLTALCAGIAGIIGTADIQAADATNAGLNLELDAILAVSVGGTFSNSGRFSIFGSVVGAILMQTLTTTILTRGVSADATLIIKAIVVVTVCLLQSPEFRNLFSKLGSFVPKKSGGVA